MSSKELIGQIEALAKVNTAYESQIIELGKVLTATDAETKRASSELKLTQAGLAKSETHAGKLSNEVAQLKTKLSAEVHANATNKLHWGQQEAALNKNLSQLQTEHEATLKTLKATQLALQQTQEECTELKANLTLTRDKYSTTRASLIESERILGLESKSRESFQLAAERAKHDYALLQGSLPKQIQALNDAKNAAMVETANTRTALDAANLMLGEREN
jgi:chromosome segregation ATPase